MLVDIEQCVQKEVLVDFLSRGELNLQGVSYSPDGEALLYGVSTTSSNGTRTYQIFKLDLKTRQTIQLVSGINPSWSPDGTQFAYLQLDGIYLIKPGVSQPRLVIKHDFADSQGGFQIASPFPRWSPDGNWLVYHLCDNDDCSTLTHAIYKAEISSGKEVKIISGGSYPDWKK